MNISVGNSPFIQDSLGNLDIQTAILMVQSRRYSLVNDRLVAQVKAVEEKNNQIARLNNVLTAISAFKNRIAGTGADDTAKNWSAKDVKNIEMKLNDAIDAAGLTDLGLPSNNVGQRTPKEGEKQDGAVGKLIVGPNVVNGATTRGQLDIMEQKLKGMNDALSNNQQLDMVALQSLMGKANESVELMTNTAKKFFDSREGIIRAL